MKFLPDDVAADASFDACGQFEGRQLRIGTLLAANSEEMEAVMKITLLILAAALVAGCERNQGGAGANSWSESSGSGERGLSNNMNAVGSPLGPLGATNLVPYGAHRPGGIAHTGTTSEAIIKTPQGQPATGTQPNPPQ
jgi:hypothetical protein